MNAGFFKKKTSAKYTVCRAGMPGGLNYDISKTLIPILIKFGSLVCILALQTYGS